MELLKQLLTSLADFIVYNLLNLDAASSFGSSLHYFIVGFTEISLLVIDHNSVANRDMNNRS